MKRKLYQDYKIRVLNFNSIFQAYRVVANGIFPTTQYNVENIAEAANAYMDWQIRPGVAEGSIMGGGVSSHFKGSGLDIEVYQSYESLVDFAKHVENGSGGNAEARVKFWTNVQGQHTDQIYLHIGHMENGVFNLAGADR